MSFLYRAALQQTTYWELASCWLASQISLPVMFLFHHKLVETLALSSVAHFAHFLPPFSPNVVNITVNDFCERLRPLFCHSSLMYSSLYHCAASLMSNFSQETSDQSSIPSPDPKLHPSAILLSSSAPPPPPTLIPTPDQYKKTCWW